MESLVHTFAGNPLDRGEQVRRDEEQLRELAQRQDGRYLLFSKLNVAEEDNALVWAERTTAASLDNPFTVFLGTQGEVPYFATQLSDDDPQLDDWSFSDCRALAAHLPTAESGILAHARAQLDWHRRNRFCAACGQPSRAERGGQVRRCTECSKHIFPRTDPVAIMLIVDAEDGERCLLGKSQGRMVRANFYSALAGFVDQGESIEEAVRREVREEAGISVGRVRYHSSQPWPFPSSLMIGCHGVATSLDIEIDPTEMADVSWFSREDVLRALAGDHDNLRVPGPQAIAHHLIRSWAHGEISW